MPYAPSSPFTRRTLLQLAGLALAFGAGAAAANSWPTKPVTIVVPYPPGSGPDVLARGLGQRLGAQTGQTFVIENRGGANATIGTDLVARSPADGHTLLLVDRMTLSVNPLLYSKLKYGPQDLAGISEVARVNLVFVTHADAPYKTWAQMVEHARQHKGTMNVGTGGIGSVHSLSLELIKRATGTQIQDVPYKGISPAVTATLSKEVDAVITGQETVLGHIREGKLRALAIGAETRSPLLPETPTLKELGAQPDLLLSTYFTLHAPAQTPKATIDAINAAARKAMADPAFVRDFAARGLEVAPSSPAAVDQGVARDAGRLGKIIKELGLKLD